MEPNARRVLWNAMLEIFVPGKPLREACNQILAAHSGALIVVGDPERVAPLCDGGFEVNMELNPQRVFELSKMDGAITLDEGARNILKANVHLVPDADLPTTETGMRHRTAERMSRQTNAFVISISKRREIVALYMHGEKLIVEDLSFALVKVNQALQTLVAYKSRLDDASERLRSIEFADLVTVAAVARVVQRSELVRRVANEVDTGVAGLGTEGRLIRMEAEEVTASAGRDYLMLIRDYIKDDTPKCVHRVLSALAAMPGDDLLDARRVASVVGLADSPEALEAKVRPRGFRVLGRVPTLPISTVNRIVAEFGDLSSLLAADEARLAKIERVGKSKARVVAAGLQRLKERSAL